MKTKNAFPFEDYEGQFKFALLVREEKTNYGYFHVIGEFVKVYASGSIRNCSDSFRSSDSGEIMFHNLSVTCQGANDDKDRHVYGFDVRYSESFIDLERAERFCKGLSKINKGMEKLYQQYGNVSSYSQYLSRICDILKIKSFVWTSDTRACYEDCSWHHGDMPAMVYHVDCLIRAWEKPQAETEAA